MRSWLVLSELKGSHLLLARRPPSFFLDVLHYGRHWELSRWRLVQSLPLPFLYSHKGLAGFALESNMIANCSNTTVDVGVTTFCLVRYCRRVDRLEATKFLSATGGGLLIAVASGTFLYLTQGACWLCPGVQHDV